MVDAIEASRASRWVGKGPDRKWAGEGSPEEDLQSFTDHGLAPAIVNGKAGDLILCALHPVWLHLSSLSLSLSLSLRAASYRAAAAVLAPVDTAMFHAGCPAEDPAGAGPRGHGPANLLRAICVLSMAPTRLLNPELLAGTLFAGLLAACTLAQHAVTTVACCCYCRLRAVLLLPHPLRKH